MADVWSIKGITTAEREAITKAAQAADLPIGRFIVRACLALDATQPRPERDVDLALSRLAQLVQMTREVSGLKDAAARTARRVLRARMEAEGATLTADKHPLLQVTGRGAPIIEGKAA